jgi:hypothetical protein
MDPDSYTNDKRKQTKSSDPMSYDWALLESIRIRRNPVELDKINRFIIESQFRYVLPGGIILYALFLFLG